MRFARTGSLVGLASILAVVMSSCATKRTEMSKVRSRFGFEAGMWGGQGGGDKSDEKEMRSRWADAGWDLDKDGNIKGAKNKDLFSGDSRYAGKKFGKKDARLKNREMAREVYSTPEYLDRQQFKETKSAEEGKLVSRESNFDENRAGEFGREAREADGGSPGFLKGLNPFRSKSAREGGNSFETTANRQGSRAQANAAIPNPGPMPRDGDWSRAAMTMDDVKKMLSPEAFD